MTVRKGTAADLPAALAIYERARAYMRETGNPNQWKTVNPPRETLEEDVRRQQLYLLVDGEEIHGVFALIPGEDPTYGVIEGAWLNDAPYAAIHRVASAGKRRGILAECVAFCAGRHDQLRIDTHADNRIMQHLLEKLGFVRCGIIHLLNGEPRIAYQRDGAKGKQV